MRNMLLNFKDYTFYFDVFKKKSSLLSKQARDLGFLLARNGQSRAYEKLTLSEYVICLKKDDLSSEIASWISELIDIKSLILTEKTKPLTEVKGL